MQRGDNDDHPIDAHFYNRPVYDHDHSYYYGHLAPDHYHYDFAGYDHDYDRGARDVNLNDYASACFHNYDHCRSQQYGDDYQHPFHCDAPSKVYSNADLGDNDVIDDPYLYHDDDHYGAAPGDWF